MVFQTTHADSHATRHGRSGLNQTLEDFEKQTSSQVVVAVYPKMESDSAHRKITRCGSIARGAWGKKDKNNGALLLVFVQEHKMRIATGYGLEGALPDALCKQNR